MALQFPLQGIPQFSTGIPSTVCVFAMAVFICVCSTVFVTALPCMVRYNLGTTNHASCGHHRHLMVDKFLTHDYHEMIN